MSLCPFYVEFVTAYIPNEQEWESPPFDDAIKEGSNLE
jgi:hypothetical protein